jgi:FkbM family methyltransferase
MSIEPASSFAQFGEDRELRTILGKRDRGTCVEVGANDAIQDSNSYLFEQMGWDCVLVEPNPDLCNELRRVRRARVYEYAASDTSGEAVLHVAHGTARAHGVSSLGLEGEQHVHGFGFVAQPLVVRTQTLDWILHDAGMSPPLDFVTIDVEGHELAVLRGFDIERWMPRVLIVEDNSNYRDRSVRKHLARFGFVPFRRTGVNDWYARHSDAGLVTGRATLEYAVRASLARCRTAVLEIPGVRRFVRAVRARVLRGAR